MNKNGSVGILEDTNKEIELRKLIVQYDEEHNLNAKVSYKGIFEFVRQMFQEGRINFFPSYTWWKTKGKHLVDEYNVVRKKTIKITEKERLDVVDIIDLVEKYFGNKEELIRNLIPYDSLVDRLINRINTLENINIDLSEKLAKKNETLDEYQEKFKKQESLIDALFYSCISSERELKQILELGMANSKALNSSLAKTFGSPLKYLNEFTARFQEESIGLDNGNIVQLKNKDTPPQDEDDYNW